MNVESQLYDLTVRKLTSLIGAKSHNATHGVMAAHWIACRLLPNCVEHRGALVFYGTMVGVTRTMREVREIVSELAPCVDSRNVSGGLYACWDRPGVVLHQLKDRRPVLRRMRDRYIDIASRGVAIDKGVHAGTWRPVVVYYSFGKDMPELWGRDSGVTYVPLGI